MPLLADWVVFLMGQGGRCGLVKRPGQRRCVARRVASSPARSKFRLFGKSRYDRETLGFDATIGVDTTAESCDLTRGCIGRVMKIGVPLFRLRPAQLAPVARRAEDLGFESVWVPEHLVFPAAITSRYPYAADGVPPVTPATPLLDPFIQLTYIAAQTSRIRLGTNIYIVPLRHPLETARLAMTLDLFSGGRLTLGVGVGWLAEEFEAVGIDFASRGARTRECVRAIKALWTEVEPEFHGRFFSFGPVKFEPKPVQRPHPPLVFGGETAAALKRAAALGDGWYGVGHTPESAAAQIHMLRELRAGANRGQAAFEITVSHRGPSLSRDDLRRYEDVGVHRAVVLPWTRGSEAEDALARLADAVG
jgi:probable F420-dependent oxidoreductase